MSFQAYLDNIYAKTGVTAGEFKVKAAEKGLKQHADILQWLKAEYGLGTGHARAIADVILHEEDFKESAETRVAKYFSGGKSGWLETFNALLGTVQGFGPDVEVSPASSYLSLVRGGKKFAVVAATSERLDIGIKRKGAPAGGRFQEAGSWNAMVTHRVAITESQQVDAEVIAWLREAYNGA